MSFLYKNKLLIAVCTFYFAVLMLIFYNTYFNIVYAQGALPLPGSPKFGDLANPSGTTAEAKLRSIYEVLYQDILYIIGGIAVAFTIYSGFRLVTAGGEDEVINKHKTAIKWSIIGLVFISMAPKIDKIFFFPTDENEACSFICNTEHILASAGIFNESVFIIIALIKYVIGFIAILYIVVAAANLVINGFKEDVIEKEKKNITIGVVSLLGINLANYIVNKIFFRIEENVQPFGTLEPTFQIGAGTALIIGITNFVVTFVGPIAILGLIVGALYYVISLGDDSKMETAKKILINSVIGILIIYGAFGFVATFVSGSITTPGELVQEATDALTEAN